MTYCIFVIVPSHDLLTLHFRNELTKDRHHGYETVAEHLTL